MVGQHCGGKKEKREVSSVCGFHRLELVDATVGHPRMSFLDAFQGYHQIPLALNDQEKTAFVTPTRNYHYKVMLFSLKNAGSTYQRMMTRIFEP